MSNPLSPDPNQNLLPSTSFSALNWEPQQPNPAVILQSDLLIGHINQNPNIPAVTPNPSDSLLLAQIEGSIATIDPNITLPNDNSFDGLTGEAMDIVKEQLTQFAKVPNFVEKMNLAFGESWDNQAANSLTQDWLNGDFSLIPPVKFVSSAEIGGANGAFASATDTIYLSRELLTENGANPAAVADVLLEEIGHSVDTRLNITDAPGDEGANFAAVVQGKVLSEGELQGLRGEDDRATVLFNGQTISIEKADDYYDQNWGGQIFDWSSGKNESKGWYRFTLNGGNAISSRNAISRNWGDGAPNSNLGLTGSDKFGVNFYTKADFEAGKTYEFSVKADDFYRIGTIPVSANFNEKEWVKISGQDWKWFNDAYDGKKYSFTPGTTGKYWVYAGYGEKDGAASFSLSWDQVNGSSYISGLSSLTDGQWDQQSGDGYYFDNIPGNASQDASSDLKQVSKDLSTALLGEPFYMSTGYAYDTASIYDADRVSHAGIDYSYDATIGETDTKILNKRVNAIVKGKVVNVHDYGNIGKFVTVEGEDKKLWLYGHIETSKQVEDEVNAGEEIGKVYNQYGNTHLHLEIHTPPFNNNIINGVDTKNPQESNLSFVLNNTMSPLQAYWQYRNNIK
jgi:hypothetical protein